MEDSIKKGLYITAGVFVLLSAIGVTWLVADTDAANLYYCKDSGTVGLCFKLSSDSDGLSKRCYWNESSPAKYKYCSTGWNKYNYSVTGTETKLPDFEEKDVRLRFDTKAEAVEYVDELLTDTKAEMSLTRIEQKLDSYEFEVFWRVTIYKEKEVLEEVCDETSCEKIPKIVKDIIHSEELSSKVPETATKEEIESTVEKHFNNFVEGWKPNIVIEINET